MGSELLASRRTASLHSRSSLYISYSLTMETQREILSEYPLPIREVYLKVINADGPLETHLQLGYLFEIVLKYTAVVSIAEYAQGHIPNIRVIDTLKHLYGKLPLGHWVGFLRESHRFNLKHHSTVLPQDYFVRSKAPPKVIDAYNAVVGYVQHVDSRKTSISLEDFVNAMVTYRNKTKGHGAITRKHAHQINEVLITGMEVFLGAMGWMKDCDLVYISNIRLTPDDRLDHSLVRMMGPDPLKHGTHTTDSDGAKMAECLYLCHKPRTPFLPLHPFLIFKDEEFYLINESVANERLEYLCYASGRTHRPDRLVEQFSEALERIWVIDVYASRRGRYNNSEETYMSMLHEAYADGVVTEDERRMLTALKLTLSLSDNRAEELERHVIAEIDGVRSAAVDRRLRPEHEKLAEVYVRSAYAYEIKGEHEKAIDACQRALELDPASVGAYDRLGGIHERRGEWTTATEYLAEGLAIARTKDEREKEMHIIHSMARCLRVQGKWQDATRSFEESLDLARSLNHPLLKAKNLYSLAGMYRLQGYRIDEAIKYCRESVRIFREIDYPQGMAEAWNYLCLLHGVNCHDYETGATYGRKSYRLFLDYGDFRRAGYAARNLGLVCCEAGRFDAAMTWFKRSLAIFERLQNDFNIAHTLQGMGAACRELGNLREAERLLSRCSEVFRSLDTKGELATTLFHLGLLQERKGSLSRAVRTFKEALHLAQETGSHRIDSIRQALRRTEKMLKGRDSVR